jgi:hypothetical protein
VTETKLIKCFACLGHKFQGHFVCSVCQGAGTLDVMSVCGCGRPAIRKVKDKMICHAVMCEKRVTDNLKVYTYNQDDFDKQYQGMF